MLRIATVATIDELAAVTDASLFPARVLFSDGTDVAISARPVANATLAAWEASASIRWTPQLAACRLHLCHVDDVRAAVAELKSPPPDPKPTRSVLDLAADLARQRHANDAGMQARIDRALDLAQAGAVERAADLGPGHFRVTSGPHVYTCNAQCDCADFQWRGQVWCKHRIAVALVLRAQQIASPAHWRKIALTWPGIPKHGTRVTLGDKTVVIRRDFDFDDAVDLVRACGWRHGGNGGHNLANMWLNPAFDAIVQAECDASRERFAADAAKRG